MYSHWTKIISLILCLQLQFLMKDTFAYPIDTSKISFNGSGCPLGSDFKITYNSTLNILKFEPAIMMAQTNSEKIMERTNCSLSLPLVGVRKKRLIIKQVDLEGELSLREKESSTISFEPFMAGNSNPPYREVFNGLQDKNFHISKSFNSNGPCGKAINLRFNFSATNQGDGISEVSYTKINKIVIYLAEQKCKK